MGNRLLYGAALLLLLLGSGCNKEKLDISASNYPEDVGRILKGSCATDGCHTAQSAPGASGLNLETWEGMFEGNRGGSPVIPYAPEFSYLLYTVNNDSTLGPVLAPTMPLNQAPLSSDEYYTLWHWVNSGCLNANGEERFPPDPTRQKYYVGHSECDEVAIFDAKSRQVMRMLKVGKRPDFVEYVYDIQVTPDGQDWFVVFLSTNTHIERYSTLTDEKVADIDMGEIGWGNIAFSQDSRFAFVSNDFWEQLGVVDLSQNALVAPPVSFNHDTRGPVIHPTRNQVYLAEHQRSSLVVLDFDANGGLSNQREVDLIQGIPPSSAGGLWPWEVLFLPDGSKYFVSCSNNNEIRVMDGQTDSLLDVIPMPAEPSRMALSEASGRVFISCMVDDVSWGGDPLKLGSINVVNTNTHQVERTVYSGFQPYGLTVDDENGVLVVANRNSDPSGPAPHHESPCGDRNGYVSLIDLTTLELVDEYKPELLVDPIVVSRK